MIQEEGANDAEKSAARGTVKAAMLEGDLVTPSVYDTKPVHYFLSMITGHCINWTQKEKLVCTMLILLVLKSASNF